MRRHSPGWTRPPATSMSWSPATVPSPRVPTWRPASPPIMPTSTRSGEERNRSTRVWTRTGSPASTGRTWNRREAGSGRERSQAARRNRSSLARKAKARSSGLVVITNEQLSVGRPVRPEPGSANPGGNEFLDQAGQPRLGYRVVGVTPTGALKVVAELPLGGDKVRISRGTAQEL